MVARPTATGAAGVRMPIMTRAPGPGSLGVRHLTPAPGVATAAIRQPQSTVPPPPYPGIRPNVHVANHNRLPVIPGGATVTAVPATVAGNELTC